MRRTFPTLRLKNMIRLCSLLLAACCVMNANTAKAVVFTRATHTVAHGAGVYDTIHVNYCGVPYTHLSLDSLLELTDTTGDHVTITNDVTFGTRGVVVVGSSDTAGTFIGLGSGHAFDIPVPSGHIPFIETVNYTTSGMFYYLSYPPNGSTQYIKFVVSSQNGGSGYTDHDTVILAVVVNPFEANYIFPISSSYNQVHVGQHIQLTEHSISGHWTCATPSLDTVNTNSGTVYGVSAGSSVITYTMHNACIDSSVYFNVTVLSNTAPRIGTGSSTSTMGLQTSSFTINGSNFTTNSKIYFSNGIAATSFSVASSGAINVTVPTAATYGPITILDTVTHLTSVTNNVFLPLYDSSSFDPSTGINMIRFQNIPLHSQAAPYGNAASYGAGATGTRPYSVEMADIDGDGKLDVVIAGTGMDSITVLRNITTDTNHVLFASPVYLPMRHVNGAINVKVGDFDADGKVDIAVAASTSASIDIIKNLSDSGFINFAPDFYVTCGILPTEMVLGDFNRDGRLDIGVVCNGYYHPSSGDNYGGSFEVLENGFNPAANLSDTSLWINRHDFTRRVIHQYPATDSAQPLSICAADFNGDGAIDVALTDHKNRLVEVYHNTSVVNSPVTFAPSYSLSTGFGTGTFAAGVSSGTPYDYSSFLTGYPNQVRAGDVDGDGIPDLFVAVTDSDLLTSNVYNYVLAYKGTATGLSGVTPYKIAVQRAPVGLAVADFDGDHKPDLAVTNAGMVSVSIIKNTTSGGAFTSSSFAPAIHNFYMDTTANTNGLPNKFAGPVCVAAGDLTGNTVPDIALVNREMNTLTLLTNYPRPSTYAIRGVDSVCAGSSITIKSFHRQPATATWRVTNTTHASISFSSSTDTMAVLTGLVPGMDTVIYDVQYLHNDSTVQFVFKISDSGTVTAITGGSSTLCAGATETLTDTTQGGGVWSSTNPSVATISTTGVVTTVAFGVDTIKFTPNSVCYSGVATQVFTVDTARGYGVITGADSVCAGSNVTLTDTITGGTWSSSNTAVATVAAGIVHGLTGGTTTISYTHGSACGAAIADTLVMTVNTIPSAGTLSGVSSPDSVCAGSTTLINTTVSPITWAWSSSDTSIATVNTTGLVTGVRTVTAVSTATISYVVTAHGCNSSPATLPVTVKPLSNAGTIVGASPICVGLSQTVSASGASSAGTWSVTGSSASRGSSITTGGVYTADSVAYVDTIKYTVVNPLGCGTAVAVAPDTIKAKPNPSITPGTSYFCFGTTLVQNGSGSSTAVGTWANTGHHFHLSTATGSSTTLIADSSTHIGASDTLIFTATNGCGTKSISKLMQVAPLADTGTITGPSIICVGSHAVFYNTQADTNAIAAGGFWSSSTTRAFNYVASNMSDTVLGVTSGTTIISYTAQSALCGPLSTSFPLTINRSPNAGFITGPTHVCLHSSITLNDSAGFVSYWTSGDSTVANVSGWSSATTSVTVTGDSVGTVVIYNTDTASGACADTLSATSSYTIIVDPLAPYPGLIVGTDSICMGSPFYLVDTTAPTVPRSGWSVSSAAIANITSTSVNHDTIYVTPISGGTAIFTFSDTNGCGVNATTHAVKVNNKPVFTSPLTQSVCDGKLFTYTATSDSALSTGISYLWNRAVVTGISNAAANDSVNTISETLVNSTNTSHVVSYVFATSLHGCNDTATVSVTVNPTPKLTSALSGEVCNGSMFNYIDTESTGPTTTANWVRSNVSNVINPANSGSHAIHEVLNDTVQLAGSVNYIYTLTSAGCTNLDTVHVVVAPTAAVPRITTHGLASVCSGTMYQNFGTAFAPVSPTSYNWYASGGAEVWATGNTKQYCLVNFTTPGISYVYVQASLSGYNCPIRDSFNVNITNSISDNPEVIYFNNAEFICLSNVESSYQWGVDDAGTLDSSMFYGQTNQNYTETNPNFTRYYYWVIVNHNGCENKIYYITPLAIKNVNSSEVGMNVYPNPASQTINVELSNMNGGDVKVELSSMLGQRISAQDVTGGKTTFDISNLSTGVYLVDCYRDGIKIGTAKFVKN